MTFKNWGKDVRVRALIKPKPKQTLVCQQLETGRRRIRPVGPCVAHNPELFLKHILPFLKAVCGTGKLWLMLYMGAHDRARTWRYAANIPAGVLLTSPASLPRATDTSAHMQGPCPALWKSLGFCLWGGTFFLKSHFIDTLNPVHSAPFEAVWKCETHTVSE